MTDTDIAAKGVLIKYFDNEYHYMHKMPSGDIVGVPQKKGALLFTPAQAKKFINHLMTQNFPFRCGPEVVQ